MNKLILPEGVGPHEGREFELMVAGRKPLARFCEVAEYSGYFPIKDFAPLLVSGLVVERERTYRSRDRVPIKCLYYPPRQEAWRIDAPSLANTEPWRANAVSIACVIPWSGDTYL